MKKFIQVVLLLLLVLIIYFFYKSYFKEVKDIVNNDITLTKIENNKSDNNFIKKLTYQINIDKNQKYFLESDVSEISYVDGIEIVKMQGVKATFVDSNFETIIITSNNALFNNENYNTEFSDTVKVEHLKNIIESENLILDFEKKIITITGNAKYNGLYGNLISDNIQLDLITKKISIFMNKPNDKVFVRAKQ